MSSRKKKKQVDPEVKLMYSLPPYTKITKAPAGNSLIPTIGQGYIADIELSEERYRFNSTTTPNPHIALNIFVQCVEKGFYPPAEILTYICEKFKEYLNGEKSLVSVTGLNKTKKKKYRKENRDRKIALEIDAVRNLFNVTVQEAIGIVTNRYAMDGIHLSDNTITDINNRDGRRQVNRSLKLIHDDFSWLDDMSPEFKKKWINDFLGQCNSADKKFLQNRIKEK